MSEQAQLTSTAEDYVKVVWNAGEWSDEPVTTKFLAQRMDVSAPTVSENVRKLSDAGLLDHKPYGAITLTTEGRAHAVAMVRRHRLIETFLVSELGYGWDEVHDEAEVLEHACSDRMIDAMDAALGHPTRDPHGDPIPRPDGTVDRPPAQVLAAVPEGTWRVIRISDADPELLRRCDDVALTIDTVVTVHSVEQGVRVSHAGTPAPFTFDSDAAASLWVVAHKG